MTKSEGKVDVLLGLQWGDEGKGKVVDALSSRYCAVARYQGGPNAGHTLSFAGGQHVLRSIPSGIFHEDTINIIGNGVVLAPDLFMDEVLSLEGSGYAVRAHLLVSKKAHLILPTHRLLDAAYECQRGAAAVGTTGKGIGPTYTDKVSRCGLRVGDLLDDFDAKYAALRSRHVAILESLSYPLSSLAAAEERWLEGIAFLRSCRLVDGEHAVNALLGDGQSVLAEGAQGTLLDVDYGSYPFVTSSSTIASGACVGLGVAPQRIGEVYGIMKAYCTRVGAGPFPTELDDAAGALLRQRGHEYGAVTGRARRCGWLDLVALRYAIMVNGVTQLILMKSDVLDPFDTIKVCVAYDTPDGVTRSLPFDISKGITPVYATLPGWQTPLSSCTSEEQFPAAFKEYIAFVERELSTPITILSVGADRCQTIFR